MKSTKLQNPSKEIERILSFIREKAPNGVVLGVSGGVDSAVVAELCKKAIGQDKVFEVYMPHLSGQIATAPSHHAQVELEYLVKQLNVLHTQNPLVLGNVASRMRMTVLYYFASILGRRVVGTTNKSEWMTGYFTKYGDGAADFEPILHLYKTQVYELARELKIDERVLNQPPSAGFYRGQEDERELGMAYSELDSVLEQIMAEQDGVNELVVKLILNSNHKRKMPDSLLGVLND